MIKTMRGSFVRLVEIDVIQMHDRQNPLEK